MHGTRNMIGSAAGFSSGLNLLQGFDGRMEAKLLREKLLIRGRVSLLGACAALRCISPRLRSMKASHSIGDAHQRPCR